MGGAGGQRRTESKLKRVDCVGALMVRTGPAGEEILLVWNADWRVPSWSLPGGAREPTESLEEAIVREVREETGLEIEIEGVIDLHEIIGLGGHVHLVIHTFSTRVTGGALVRDGAGEPLCGGVTAASWFPITDALGLDGLGLNRILNRVGDPSAGSYSCDRRNERRRPVEPHPQAPAHRYGEPTTAGTRAANGR